MKKNKLKDSSLISHPINSQKIKNLIHLNDLKKLKKYSVSNTTNNYNNYISQQLKSILKKLTKKYNRGVEYYRRKVINDIIENESTHLVASFKEYLIYGDYSEFLQGYFEKKEIKKFLPLIFGYYISSTVIFPNYVMLEEKKYLYKNIQKKQQIINNQQEQEELEKKKKDKEKEKEEKLNEDDDNINFESDLTSKSDVLTSHALNSILNQTNTSNNIKLFGLNNNNNTSDDLVQFIEKLNNEEKKVNLKKNKNNKNRNKHLISIYKGNNSKKENNKSNTNTYNTISTKNNTKGKEKEKSNVDTKSFSDKNIKNNYNLNHLSLNQSKNINKNFLLKLDEMKKKNEVKSPKNILLEISSLTSRKLNNINFFSKKNKKSQFLADLSKPKKSKIDKKIIDKENVKNYKYNYIKRIKSCYGINNSYSRNKKVYSQNTVMVNSSNKIINPYGISSLKVCSTLCNTNNDNNNLLSIETDRRHHKQIKKNKNVFDYKIINMIYSNRSPNNSLNKITDSKKTSRNKYYKKINYQNTITNKNNSLKKKKHSKHNFSPNNSKLANPFEARISPPGTFRGKNKKILKFALLSPTNINSKFSNSRIIPKKQLNKNVNSLNNKKMKLKKEIKRIINETKSSNKTLTRNNLDKEEKIKENNDYLTINVDKSHKRNIIDIKKNIGNKNDNNTIKSGHHRVKTLCSQSSYFYNKEKKQK